MCSAVVEVVEACCVRLFPDVLAVAVEKATTDDKVVDRTARTAAGSFIAHCRSLLTVLSQ
jgi:hypothetical protein